MVSLDRQRRINIVRFITTTIIGLVIAYLIPEILGFAIKSGAKFGGVDLSSEEMRVMPNLKLAMMVLSFRIIHIFGLVICGIGLIGIYVNWAARFVAPRAGED